MLKSAINTIPNYSPNFDTKKRKQNQIKFIIFHYTGMKKEKQAIQKLTNSKSKVSCHYFVKNNGDILNLVPDKYVAWHAGISFWKNYKSINKYSLGIEISNPGHANQYKRFSKKQIDSVIKLSSYLIKKYKIKFNYILGHSDIAPDRKKDPGEKFPWKLLAKKKIGFWHDLKEKKILKKRNIIVKKTDTKRFIQNLSKIGYQKKFVFEDEKNYKILTEAFQRRFRQNLINGVIDEECLLISNNLIKKF